MNTRNHKIDEDAVLTALLQEAYTGDPALQPDAARTARIMQLVRANTSPAHNALADTGLTALLRETDDEEAVAEAPGRTERIMRLVRRQSGELPDPTLTALLRQTYADDPALRESPGRADRIMRGILSGSGRWTLPHWLTGALGTAAVAAAVLLIVLQPPKLAPIAVHPGTPSVPSTQTAVNPSVPTVPSAPHTQVVAVAPDLTPPAPVAQPRIHPRRHHLRTPVLPAAVIIAKAPLPETPPTVNAGNPAAGANTDTNQMHVAGTLYATGATAHSVGDFETAYQAYQASYDTVPTPGALMASAQALEELAHETIAADDEVL